MAESGATETIEMTGHAGGEADGEQRQHLLIGGRAEQQENNRRWRSLIPNHLRNSAICNNYKMWLLIVLIAAIVVTIISVILGIRYTSIDDEYIDPDLKIHGTPRYYIGSMKLPRCSFTTELTVPQSKNFFSLSEALNSMLKQLYSTSPALGYYFVDSDVFSFSNGSLIAYYWLQFALPKEQDLLLKYTLSIEVLVNILRQHLHTADVRKTVEVEPSSVTLHVADEQYVQSLKTGKCVSRILLENNRQSFDSLDLVNCWKTSNYWLVQGENGYFIKASILTRPGGPVCSGVDVASYSTWFLDPEQTVSKFRQIGQSFKSEIIASGNILLVAFNPTAGCDRSQYSISFLQVPATECGGVLGGTNGSFMSPQYSTDRQEDISCIWNLKLQKTSLGCDWH
ncbi:suppressor of tumorigenicity 14 protein-like isoform X3 [Narcine bancroftii]|uniref:suppressor of tumorigenicity 14 protein-like isoform X3 n=1 Tax=Narcine bancroftii TaxID=1343680 RepID=UPI003831E69A